MRSFIVILVIVGAICVVGYFLERAEHQRLTEAVMSGEVPIKWGENEGIKEAYIDRRRDGMLFYGGFGLAIFLWVFTSVMVWLLWKLILVLIWPYWNDGKRYMD